MLHWYFIEIIHVYCQKHDLFDHLFIHTCIIFIQFLIKLFNEIYNHWKEMNYNFINLPMTRTSHRHMFLLYFSKLSEFCSRSSNSLLSNLPSFRPQNLCIVTADLHYKII